MKILCIGFIILLVSFQSQASLPSMLIESEVEALQTKLSEKGFQLTQVMDVYAERGVTPRCPCQSYELSFVKHLPRRSLKKFAVQIQGFGAQTRVQIEEIR